jgi:hypothetical protein
MEPTNIKICIDLFYRIIFEIHFTLSQIMPPGCPNLNDFLSSLIEGRPSLCLDVGRNFDIWFGSLWSSTRYILLTQQSAATGTLNSL